MARTRIVILGAAGRDFHNFNVLYRNHPDIEVVAFTATQIPHIDGRAYPPELAGADYPGGIPIIPETELRELLQREELDAAVFSYSDVPYDYVMRRSALVNAYGADFVLLAPRRTMLPSVKPVIAVSAVRTGCGKSQTTRRIAEILRERGYSVVVMRHPMPYGDLAAQKVQRFGSDEDLETQNCTIEEMEEYEPHVAAGSIVYAGVDYEAILRRPRRRRTSSCGTAATTTRPSTERPARRRWPIRTAPATRSTTTRARPTCAWPTWWSSTRWSRRIREHRAGAGQHARTQSRRDHRKRRSRR